MQRLSIPDDGSVGEDIIFDVMSSLWETFSSAWPGRKAGFQSMFGINPMANREWVMVVQGMKCQHIHAGLGRMRRGETGSNMAFPVSPMEFADICSPKHSNKAYGTDSKAQEAHSNNNKNLPIGEPTKSDRELLWGQVWLRGIIISSGKISPKRKDMSLCNKCTDSHRGCFGCKNLAESPFEYYEIIWNSGLKSCQSGVKKIPDPGKQLHIMRFSDYRREDMEW